MQKLKNIEFLRIFLIITIVFYHMRFSLKKIGTDFFIDMFRQLDGGRNSVEAFFIIAGFFLVLTFKNKSTWGFIKKKYFRLMPAAMFSIIVCGIASCFKIMHFKLIPNIIMGLLFSHFGIYWCKGSNIVLWYASALLFGFIIFYFIIKFLKEKYQILLYIIFGFGSYIILSSVTGGTYKGHSVMYLGFIPACTLRAFGGIGIGCLIAKIYQKYKEQIKNWNINIIQKIIISLIEILAFGFIVWWSYFKLIKIDNSLYVFIFSILFICFICNKGFLSQITNKDFWTKISIYTYSLYVIHFPVIRILAKKIILPNKIILSQYPIVVISVVFMISFIIAIITFHTIEKPCYDFLSEKFIKKNRVQSL